MAGAIAQDVTKSRERPASGAPAREPHGEPHGDALRGAPTNGGCPLDRRIAYLPQLKEGIMGMWDIQGLQALDSLLPPVGDDCSAANDRLHLVIESQRGATISGNHIYSRESLIYPLDPSRYETLHGETLAELRMYPDPGLCWRWKWSCWHVLMAGDVDESGWAYAGVRFGSKHWGGVGTARKFVRRRVWVRLAEKISSTDACGVSGDSPRLVVDSAILTPTASRLDPFMSKLALKSSRDDSHYEGASEIEATRTRNSAASAPSSVSHSTLVTSFSHLLHEVANAPIDRIRIDKIVAYVIRSNEAALAHLNSHETLGELLDHFTFRESRMRLLARLEEKLKEIEDATSAHHKNLVALIRGLLE